MRDKLKEACDCKQYNDSAFVAFSSPPSLSPPSLLPPSSLSPPSLSLLPPSSFSPPSLLPLSPLPLSPLPLSLPLSCSPSQDVLQGMKTKLTAKIDLVNSQLECPLNPRNEMGQLLDCSKASMQELFKVVSVWGRSGGGEGVGEE